MGKIGNVEIKGKVILAPMAGVTNEAFFYVTKKYGAALLCSEMISDKGILYNNSKTLSMINFDDSLRPFSIQLFGYDKDELASAAKILYEKSHPDIIDVNMGCSVPKIYNNGQGCALMKNPEYVGEIVKALVEAVPCPITIKIRSGIDHKRINCLEVAKEAEKNGASAITIHPRTKSDLFSGDADYSLIKLLKDNLSIPVIGSGDIKTPMDAKRMLDETGCDYCMVGRAAMGNPFIFKEINEFLETGSYNPVSDKEKFETMLEHFNHLMELKGEKIAVMEMRSHAAWYVKGMKDSTVFKATLNECRTKDEFLDLVTKFRNQLIGQ